MESETTASQHNLCALVGWLELGSFSSFFSTELSQSWNILTHGSTTFKNFPLWKGEVSQNITVHDDDTNPLRRQWDVFCLCRTKCVLLAEVAKSTFPDCIMQACSPRRRWAEKEGSLTVKSTKILLASKCSVVLSPLPVYHL